MGKIVLLLIQIVGWFSFDLVTNPATSNYTGHPATSNYQDGTATKKNGTRGHRIKLIRIRIRDVTCILYTRLSLRYSRIRDVTCILYTRLSLLN